MLFDRWFFKDYPEENIEHVDNYLEKKYQTVPIDVFDPRIYCD